MNSIDQSHFKTAYAGLPPWEIGRPQNPLVRNADLVASPLLDVGCGTGDAALFFASRGVEVVGMDFVPEAVDAARLKASDRGMPVSFEVRDALTLVDEPRRFATATDSGLFHVFGDDDRAAYVRGLHHVLKPGGRLLLLCFSDEEPGTIGPRRIAEHELKSAFAEGWAFERLERVQFEVNEPAKSLGFSEGGPKAWFAVVRRV